MLDISFSELLICFVVALVVLGPEKVPRLVRTIGNWTGRARVYMRNLTAELDRESRLSELKQQLEEANQLVRDQQRAVQNLMTRAENGFRDVGEQVRSATAAPADAAAVTADPTARPSPGAAAGVATDAATDTAAEGLPAASEPRPADGAAPKA